MQKRGQLNDAFRHLHMPAELAGECLTVFSRVEYALKATDDISENEDIFTALSDKYANEIDEAFG